MSSTSLPPGFRFHPTDDELISHYLRNRAASLPCPVPIIADVDIYKFDPWDLPAKAIFGEREWYFFTPRDRKYPNGLRPNRAAVSGYWKATGTDKPIGGKESIGVKKALVFYMGRPPKGIKTDWIMHEYRLTEHHAYPSTKPMKLREYSSMRLDGWVLCRIYKKDNHPTSFNRVQGGEERYLPISPTTTHQNKISLIKLPKAASLSDLFDAVDYSILSRLLGSKSELLESRHEEPFMINSNKNANGSSNTVLQQLSETDSTALIAQNSTCLENGGVMPHQLGNRQNRRLNQPLLNQEWVLRSHLSLHEGAHF